jgi:hypothetical protein
MLNISDVKLKDYTKVDEDQETSKFRGSGNFKVPSL